MKELFSKNKSAFKAFKGMFFGQFLEKFRFFDFFDKDFLLSRNE